MTEKLDLELKKNTGDSMPKGKVSDLEIVNSLEGLTPREKMDILQSVSLALTIQPAIKKMNLGSLERLVIALRDSKVPFEKMGKDTSIAELMKALEADEGVTAALKRW